MGWLSNLWRRGGTAEALEEPSREEVEGEATRGARRTPSPTRLTTLNFDRFLREHPAAVVDVWAPWCGPCRAFAPVFAQAAARWGDQVGFGKVHADHEPSLVSRFGVRSIPSLLFFRDGELVRTEVGVVPPERLARHLRRTFGTALRG